MKQIFTILILLSAAATANAGKPLIKLKINNGTWSLNSSWSLGRTPMDGDSIVVPLNYTVILNTAETLNNVFIRITGNLVMSDGQLILNAASRIYLFGYIANGVDDGNQITIGNVLKFDDSKTVMGPVFADVTTGAAPNGFNPLSILPVTFTNFNVSKSGNNDIIRWSTATESNSNRFEVERSADGKEWITIAIVMSVGNSNIITNYSFTDKNVSAAVSYYRIRQVDNDENSSYTAVRTIKNVEDKSTVNIYLSSNKNVNIQFDAVKSNVSVRVMNMSGQPVMQKSYQQSSYIIFQLNNTVPGLYVVQVVDENNQTETKKILL